MSRARLPGSGLLFDADFMNGSGENGETALSCFRKLFELRPLELDLTASDCLALPVSPKLYLSVSWENNLDLFRAEVVELFKLSASSPGLPLIMLPTFVIPFLI